MQTQGEESAGSENGYKKAVLRGWRSDGGETGDHIVGREWGEKTCRNTKMGHAKTA
jgi:hypothetical protein